MTRTWIEGDTAPWFRGPMIGRGNEVSLDIFGGRAILMLFLGKREWPASDAAVALVDEHRELFDGVRANLIGVTLDGQDLGWKLRAMADRGDYWFHDSDARIAREYGAVMAEGAEQQYRPFWLLLDVRLRVIDRAPIGEGARIFEALKAYLGTGEGEAVLPAPVLVAPRIFEPGLCRRLIDLYEERGGTETGFFNTVDGIASQEIDHRIKRRSDYYLEDEDLKRSIGRLLQQRLFPLVERAFRFRLTRIERFNVVCYDSGVDGGGRGFFKPHRDNTTPASSHRRFACTINLNTEDHEGGELRFPEFGSQTYRAPTGGAAVFSCSLMHEALPVLRGRRYAFLPFLYDEEGQRQLEAYRAEKARRSAATDEAG